MEWRTMGRSFCVWRTSRLSQMTSCPKSQEVGSLKRHFQLPTRRLTRNLYPVMSDFYNSGSTYQMTINENSSAFNKYRLRSRVLVDVSNLSTETTCLGRTIKFPLGVSPAGLQAMAHPDGELATARACAKLGVNMAISSFSNYRVEEVTTASAGKINHAMQLYTMKDRALQERIIKKAEAAGCKAIFLTADSPVL